MKVILVADDKASSRELVRTVLEHSGYRVLEAADGEEAVQRALELEPDLVLLDLHIPDVSRFSGLNELRDSFPSIPVVMFSGTLDRITVREALAAGAAGFVPKSLKRNEIIDALRQVLEGEIFVPEIYEDDETANEQSAILAKIDSLTPQQRVVLHHLVNGKLNKQIAYELNVSMTTVKAHVSAILQKLNAYSRTQAVILANRVGFT